MAQLNFIGQFKDLKKLGFNLEKLFAENKHVYSKNDTLIYKAGSSVRCNLFLEIDHVYTLLKPLFEKKDFDFTDLIERNEKLDKMFGLNSFIDFYVSDSNETTLDKTQYQKEEKERWQAFAKDPETAVTASQWKRLSIPIVELENLKLLHDNNMISL